jgi:acetyl esterase
MTAARREGLADGGLADYLDAIPVDPSTRAQVIGVAGLRKAAESRRALRPPGPELPVVTELSVGEVAARLYRPTLEPRPLLVYFHGGGWILGDLESHDSTCRRLAKGAGIAVLAVDYRRAPEHPWPAAVDDAVAAVRWARGEGAATVAATVVGVAGDSAGGNIAALCCLRLRDAGEPQPAVQVLAYPNTDLTFSHPSIEAKRSGWGLEADDVRWSASLWVPDERRRADPRVSPLKEPDLSGLAPAIVVTAEHDPLRDEGDDYAAALAAAGVAVTHRCEPGLVHGFLGLEAVSPTAIEATERLLADVRDQLSAGATPSP